MRAPSLGIWPFDSEADKNLEAAIQAVAVMIRDRVWPQLTLVQKATWSTVDLYRDPWEQFVEQYMEVSRNLKRAYTSNADYYSVWEPRMRAKGWSPEILAKLMTALRELNAQGNIPQYVMNPGYVAPPGDTSTAFDRAMPWYLKPKGLMTVAMMTGAVWLLLPRLSQSAVTAAKTALRK